MTEEDTIKQGSPSFLDKLYTILEEESPHIISWNGEGDTFIIFSPELFSQKVMSKYFKSTKFNSFVRQLNFYGFKKTTRDPSSDDKSLSSRFWEFRHPQFLRGRRDLLCKIHRKQIGDGDIDTESRFRELEREVQYLYQIVSELSHWKLEVCTRYPGLVTEGIIDQIKQQPMDYIPKDPISLMDPQMKQWPSAMVQRGIQYQQTQQQIPMAMSNTLPMNSEGLPSMPIQPKQTQNMYMEETMLPPHTSLLRGGNPEGSIQITKRRKNPAYSMNSASNELGLSEEDQIGIDSSALSLPFPEGMPNNPMSIYSQDYYPPQNYR